MLIGKRYFYFVYILLISNLLIQNQTISLGFTEYLISSEIIIWSIRLTLFIILIFYIYNGISLSINIILILILIFLYGSIEILHAKSFYEFFKIQVRNTWMIANAMIIIICIFEIKNEEKKYTILALNLIIWGLLEIIFTIYLKRESGFPSYFEMMILPAYFSFGIILLLRNNGILRLLIGIFLIVLYIIDRNRSAALALLLSLLVHYPIFKILLNKYTMQAMLIFTFVYTYFSALIEFNDEMVTSFNTGRGQIWDIWLVNLFHNIGNFFLGIGAIDTTEFERFVYSENFYNGINWLQQFHSAFISTISVGGVLKFTLFLLLFFFITNNSKNSKNNLSLYYYSLIMMSFNSMVPFLFPELNQTLFFISLIIPLVGISSRNKFFIGHFIK